MLNLTTTCVPIYLLNGNLVFTDGCRLVQTRGGSNVTHTIVIDRPGRESLTIVELYEFTKLEELKSILSQFAGEISLAYHQGRTADLRTIDIKETDDIRLNTNYF